MRKATIAQAAKVTGLTEYTLRQGIKEGRIPFVRTGLGKGKYILDLDLLEEYLKDEAVRNMISQKCQDNFDVVNYGKLRAVKA